MFIDDLNRLEVEKLIPIISTLQAVHVGPLLKCHFESIGAHRMVSFDEALARDVEVRTRNLLDGYSKGSIAGSRIRSLAKAELARGTRTAGISRFR